MRLHHQPFRFHDHPDLFDWLAERQLRAADPAARRIAHRYGLSIFAAATIARLAGLGGGSGQDR
jgi:hypothetical protein